MKKGPSIHYLCDVCDASEYVAQPLARESWHPMMGGAPSLQQAQQNTLVIPHDKPPMGWTHVVLVRGCAGAPFKGGEYDLCARCSTLLLFLDERRAKAMGGQ